jgi:hypothetical protein
MPPLATLPACGSPEHDTIRIIRGQSLRRDSKVNRNLDFDNILLRSGTGRLCLLEKLAFQDVAAEIEIERFLKHNLRARISGGLQIQRVVPAAAHGEHNL